MKIKIIVAVCLILVAVLAFGVSKINFKNDNTPLAENSNIFVNKIVCYSNAYATQNVNNNARWDLNLSQYTDIAIYLDVKLDVNSMFINNISFSNQSNGNLALIALPITDFGKSFTNETDFAEFKTPEKIDFELSSPITIRYWNQNFKKNCLITDVDEPLYFDGSMLKRGKVTLSSLKNTISFNLHVIDKSNKDYSIPVSIPIRLDNKESGKSIYDGSFLEEQLF